MPAADRRFRTWSCFFLVALAVGTLPGAFPGERQAGVPLAVVLLEKPVAFPAHLQDHRSPPYLAAVSQADLLALEVRVCSVARV